jgi:hypothetical protein
MVAKEFLPSGTFGDLLSLYEEWTRTKEVMKLLL